jgi:cytidylate kinase
VAAAVRVADLFISTDPDHEEVRIHGTDVTAEIREPFVSEAVSAVATNLEARAELARRQRDIIEASGRIVAEGRDITTVVAPDADVRILLTASEEARLRRRSTELHGHAEDHAVAATRDQIVRRDRDDSTVSQFTFAADGVTLLDTSDLDFGQSVQAVLDIVRAAPARA